MADTLFIQFYGEGKRWLNFYNAFSDTYDLCKSKGDFLWVNLNDVDVDLPISKGTIYVSSIFLEHLDQTIKWAKRYPNIKFIVGGQSIQSFSNYTFGIDISKNIEVTTKSVEQYFGVSDFSYKWKFKIPIKSNKEYNMMSYTLDTSCYWGKCIFCNFYNKECRIRRECDFSVFENIGHDGKIWMKLNSNTFNPFYIKKIPDLPNLKNFKYQFNMRCDKANYTAIEKVLEKLLMLYELRITLGIEFPTNHILDYMKKGITVDDIMRTLDILGKYDIEIISTFIVGWPVLTKKDLKDLSYFVKRAAPSTRTIIFRLFAEVESELHEIYKNNRDNERYVGPFYKGYYPKLNKEQKELNVEAFFMLREYGGKNVHDLTGGFCD